MLEGNEIIIQFVAEVRKEDLKAVLYDESTKQNIEFTLEATCGGTRWQVIPKTALTKGNRYKLTVLGETKGELNGIEMGTDKEYIFTY